VVEAKKQNRKAQYELYKLYSKSMYNIAMRILNHEEEAADVLQESFLDAFLRMGDFRQESSFGWWIKQIVINKSLSQVRKRRTEIIPLDGRVEDIPDECPEDNEEIEYQVNQVKEAMLVLPEHYRIILSLFLLEGYDHEEIAHILKITETTSRSQVLRAKRKLIEIIKSQKTTNKEEDER
jgi:RNA polymerase sigma-70 factor (ECF subfamily)